MNFGHKINEDMSFNFTGTLGQSKMGNSQSSLIDGTSNILSSSFNSTFNKRNNLKKGDRLSFSLSQPHKIESGKMNIRIPGLADSEGNLNYESTSISLKPSGRQLDASIDYVSPIANNLNIGFKANLSNNYNHIKTNGINSSFAITGTYSW